MSSDTQTIKPDRIQGLTTGVKLLLAVNILIFAVAYFYNFREAVELLGLHYFRSEEFRWYQFITSMFMHGGVWHIAINMFVLWMFGSPLESIWHTGKFLLYYFICGLGASLIFLGASAWQLNSLEQEVEAYVSSPAYEDYAQFFEENIDPSAGDLYQRGEELLNEWQANPDSQQYADESGQIVQNFLDKYIDRPLVGASGAIYGILLAFGLIFPNVPVYIYFVFPMKSKYLVILLGALQLYLGWSGGEPGVANIAHLGGMLTGLVLLLIWGYQKREIERQ
ncbi:MAG: rhomboid family intramembrane serine protease [Cyclobacteriaceae bacterium]